MHSHLIHSLTHQSPLQGILGACDVAQRGPKKKSNHPTIFDRSCQQIRGNSLHISIVDCITLSTLSTVDNNPNSSAVV